MRLLFSILLFISFVFRPVVEISSVLYYQLNIDYIVATYCVNKERPKLKCDGKCYLMQNLKKLSVQDKNTRAEAITLSESFLPLYFQKDIISIPENLEFINTTNNWKTIHMYSNLFSIEIDHPPNLFS